MAIHAGTRVTFLSVLLALTCLLGCEPNLSFPPARPAGSIEPLVQDLVSPQIIRIENNMDDAEEHGTLGLMYEANEMWEPAVRSFHQAMQIDPSNPLWSIHLHQCRKSAGDTTGERSRLESLSSSFSHVAPFLFQLGQARFQDGDIDSARSALLDCLRLRPAEPATLVALSDLERLTGNHPLALEYARQALIGAPGVPTILNARGQALRSLGRASEAAADLKAGLNSTALVFPDEGRRRFSEYFAAPQKLISHSADLIQAGFVQRAETLLYKVLAAVPGHKDALNNLALASRASNRLEEASVHLLQALESDPDYFPTLINLADLYLLMKQPSLSEKYALLAVEIDTENAGAHKVLALSLIQQRKFPEALQSFGQSLRLSPDDFQCHAAASEAALASQQLDAAALHLSAASRLNPDHLPVQVNLIHLLIRQGELDDADQRIKDLFKKIGDHPELVKAYAALQRARSARRGN